MIALDMIAYNPDAPAQPRARIYYAQDNSPLTQALADALLDHAGIVATIGQMGRSDHVPFDASGFDAALLIEYDVASNPHYHRLTDALETAGYIDYAYATAMTRGAVAYLADAAVLDQAPGQIPEPCTVLLLGQGVLGLWVVRRRRRTRTRLQGLLLLPVSRISP